MDTAKLKKILVVTSRKYTNSYVFLLLYVDDILIEGSSMRDINNLKTRLSATFEMKDFGPTKQIFGDEDLSG